MRSIRFIYCLLGFALIASSASAQYTKNSTAPGAVYAWNRAVNVTKPNGGYIEFLWNGNWYPHGTQNKWFVNGYTPLAVPNAGPVEFGNTTKTITYRWITSPSQTYDIIIPVGTYNVTATLSSSTDTSVIQLPPFEVSLMMDTGGQIVTSEEPSDLPTPPKEYKPYWMMFDNRTGGDLQIPFGSEMLDLAPGYNVIPFYGEVGADGFPKALPEGFTGAIHTGPDGQQYLASRLLPGVENPYDWANIPTMDIFPPVSGTGGPVIGTPGLYGGTDYINLPPGVRVGGNLPLPSGTTSGTGGTLPSGVTGGTSGGLTSGVLSGGTSYLPDGMTAGTTAGNTGTGTTEAPTTGGAVGGGNNTGGTVGGAFDIGPLMGDIESDAAATTQRIKDAVEGPSAAFDGFNWKFWTDPEVTSDQDKSWMIIPVNFGNGITKNIEISEEWVSTLRAWLLFALKVGFVWECCKLFMK